MLHVEEVEVCCSAASLPVLHRYTQCKQCTVDETVIVRELKPSSTIGVYLPFICLSAVKLKLYIFVYCI